jgi:predicted RNA-binding protein associated with RNAse of E/G family
MWSLWVFWDEGIENVLGCYINIDSAYERTRFGFDTWDMFLDVVVEADRKSWRYKDEDEFDDAIKADLIQHVRCRSSGTIGSMTNFARPMHH